jgi:AcrR family transcriptional regulator
MTVDTTLVHDTAATSTRTRILEAAIRCFASAGFHSTSMQQICTAAHLSPGGVYRHFASKDDIIAAIADYVHQRNTQFFGRMAQDGATLETFFDAGFAHLREVVQGPEGGLCCEVIAEAQRNQRVRQAFEANFLGAKSMLRSVIERLQADGSVDPTVDPETVTVMLMSIADGLIVRASFDKTLSIDAVEPGLRELVGRMLRPKAAKEAAGMTTSNSSVQA